MTQTGSAAPSSRYVTLDAMRGLAALCVAIYHFSEGFAVGGYLAVDFFFVLLGFVLMRTYGERLSAGMSSVHFMKLRFVRIMPVYWLGLLLSVVVYGVKLSPHRPADLDLEQTLVAAGLGAFMLPDLWVTRLFPLNPPSWSLFGEMVLNIVMALWLARFSNRRLAVFLIVSGLALAILAWLLQAQAALPHPIGWVDAESELNRGPHWQGWYIGLLRTCYSFTAGMLIARLPAAPARPRRLAAVGLWGLLVLLMVMAVPAIPRLYVDMLVILAISPLLTMAGSPIEPPAILAPLASFLGEVSFPLYALQWGMLGSIHTLTQKLHLGPLPSILVYLAITVFVAWICGKRLDKPLRRVISKHLASPRSNPSA